VFPPDPHSNDVAVVFEGLVEYFADQGTADAVCLRDVGQRHAVESIANHGVTIDLQRTADDVPAFELGAPHAGTLDDEIAFQFGDCRDDDDDSTAQWATGIEISPKD